MSTGRLDEQKYQEMVENAQTGKFISSVKFKNFIGDVREKINDNWDDYDAHKNNSNIHVDLTEKQKLASFDPVRYIFGDNERGSIGYSGNLNNITKSGFYYALPDATGTPGGPGCFIHSQAANSDNASIQLFSMETSDEIYFRRKQNGVWQPWRLIWNDDIIPYESGNWTPELRFGNSSAGITYVYLEGRFVRIGQVVCWSFRIILSSKGTAVGTAGIYGLPFASASYPIANATAIGAFHNVTLPSGAESAYAYIGNLSSFISLRASGNVPSGFNLTNDNFANNTEISAAGTYFID